MGNAFQELLRSTKWTVQAAAQVSYPADFTTTYAAPSGARFVRIQAHDGTLYYDIRLTSAAAPTYGTGYRRVTSGNYDIAQLGPDQTLYVGGATAGVNGSLQWGT